jgi:hypothetical protein
MALSRRLFISGLLASAAAPASITSKGFVPALREPRVLVLNSYHGVTTGRLISSEPAWQEFERIAGRRHQHQREITKRLLFAERYGTSRAFELGQRSGKTMVSIDFTDLELRMIAQREQRSMFDQLKLDDIQNQALTRFFQA